MFIELLNLTYEKKNYAINLLFLLHIHLFMSKMIENTLNYLQYKNFLLVQKNFKMKK
jgi:hypothetical protein